MRSATNPSTLMRFSVATPRLKWALAIVLLVMCCVALPSHAEALQGRIVGVIDGDTVDLLSEGEILTRIRLSGIDAPEKAQPFGKVSKRALSDLIFNQIVTVVGSKRDRYGRLVAKIEKNGQDVNLALVQAGLAWHYKKYAREQLPEDRGLYAAAEVRARRAKLGLWADAVPMAPWDYRRARRVKKPTQD